jgi:hypothetical protein
MRGADFARLLIRATKRSGMRISHAAPPFQRQTLFLSRFQRALLLQMRHQTFELSGG